MPVSDVITPAGTWGQYTIDLSQFEGAMGRFAFRHFDCSDMFYLNLDDVVVTEGNPRPAASPVAPAPASYQAPKQGLSFVPGTHRQEASSTQALNSRDVVKINAKRK